VLLVKHARIIGIAAVILVLLTSTYGYAQFSTPAVNGSTLGPEQGIPNVVAPCANQMDLSTGTNGKTAADAPGTADRWLVSGGGISVPQPAFSIGPFDSYAPPTPTGRFLWISLQNPPALAAAGPYTYSLTFPVPSQGGTFFLYGFSADNSVQLQLLTTTWSSGNYPSTGASDFMTWWVPTVNALLVSTAATVAMTGPVSATLTATVQNDASTYTGLAVYAVFCPNPIVPPFTPTWAYAVKFLCNTGSSASAATTIGLEPGFYQTDINIHNPSYSRTAVPIQMKFVLATPLSSSLGPPPATQIVPAVPSPYVLRQALLEPDAAMRLDCTEILALFPSPAPLTVAKGFVIIYSDKSDAKGSLDVWAEYTSLGPSAGAPSLQTPAIEIVTINPKPFTP